MALPLRPYHPQRFIHQKLHPNPTRMFKHQCEAHRSRSAADVQLGSSPSGHITCSASSIRSFTQIRQECSRINGKPIGPDQPLTFSMALSPQAISPAALHPSEASCSSINAKPTGADQPLTFSMALPPQAISPAALHPSEASPTSDKNVQASMRSPPEQISR